MVLSDLQRSIMRYLAGNRSETSYVAGGAVLNRDWPRQSEDIDIFHHTDEEIGDSAGGDIETLRNAGFTVRIDVQIYGIVEARVERFGAETIIQWMSESRRRFLPLVRDEAWGSRLHQADLPVNKVIAASSRQKARDFVDLVAIASYMCPLGSVIIAASGKPPFFSPQRIIDEIRRNSLSIWDEDYGSVKGIPADWTPGHLRSALETALKKAENYIAAVPADIVGCLVLDRAQVPIEIADLTREDIVFRRPTEEPEIMPEFKDVANDWTRFTQSN